MDRDYFKYKNKDKPKENQSVTECCKVDIDYDDMNVKNKDDWALIEDHIERHLRDSSSTESIKPISCDVCGRFKQYLCILKTDKRYFR